MTPLLSEIRFLFAQCVFNSKIHFKAMERYEKKLSCRCRFNAGLLIVSFLVMIASCFSLFPCEYVPNKLAFWVSLAGIVVTAVSLVETWLFKDDLQLLSGQHNAMGNEYISLRNLLMSAIRLCLENNTEEAETILKQCYHDYDFLCRFGVKTESEDYTNAQKSLGLDLLNNEEYTWSDEQIDRLLPVELRSKKS